VLGAINRKSSARRWRNSQATLRSSCEWSVRAWLHWKRKRGRHHRNWCSRKKPGRTTLCCAKILSWRTFSSLARYPPCMLFEYRYALEREKVLLLDAVSASQHELQQRIQMWKEIETDVKDGSKVHLVLRYLTRCSLKAAGLHIVCSTCAPL
jgi:hypothetical protein